MKQAKKILFVCTGNSCRSIMAEAYLNKRAGEEGLCIEVRSAGTLGTNGIPPAPETIRVLEEDGIDTKGYESAPLSLELIDWADLILVMEPAHKQSVLAVSPRSADKVLFLKGLGKEGSDVTVADPIGKPLDFYRESFGAMKQLIEELITWLKG